MVAIKVLVNQEDIFRVVTKFSIESSSSVKSTIAFSCPSGSLGTYILLFQTKIRSALVLLGNQTCVPLNLICVDNIFLPFSCKSEIAEVFCMLRHVQ